MTLREIPVPLEVTRQDRRLGRLIGVNPDCWQFRAGGERDVELPAWSALARANGPEVNHRAWFRHLLPDVPTCTQLARRLGLSPGHDFALLARMGRDCRDGLALTPAGSPPRVAPARRILDAGTLVSFARALPPADFAGAAAELDLLLPGDAGQFRCDLVDGQVVLAGDNPWLARVGRPGLVEAVENEALIRHIVTALGLASAGFRLLFTPTPLLAIQRLDRDDDGAPCHLEDFGQLAGRHPEQAFEREGGLSAHECAALVRRFSAAPALDLRVLLGWLVLSVLAGLGHAHGRSLALRETARGPRLVIGDGCLATHIHAAQSERLAMHVGREDRPDWIRPARWHELAAELGVGSRYLLAVVRDVATRLPALAAAAVHELALDTRAPQTVSRMLKLMENRARQTLIALAAEAA